MAITRVRTKAEFYIILLNGFIPFLIGTPLTVLAVSIGGAYGLVSLPLWLFVTIPIVPSLMMHWDMWRHDDGWTVELNDEEYTVRHLGQVVTHFSKSEIEGISFHRAIPFVDKESELAYFNYFIAQVAVSGKGTLSMTSMSFSSARDFKELFPLIPIAYRVRYWLRPLLSTPFWQKAPST